MTVTNGVLPGDVYQDKAAGGYVPGVGVTATQSGPSSTDAQGQASAPTVISFSPSAAVPTPGDSVAFAGLLPAVSMQQSGTALASPRRIISKFIQLKAVAITAGTPVSVYTPTSGKKFRVLSYSLSDTVAGSVLIEDTTGVEVLRTPLLLASTPYNAPEMGNGYLSSAANNQLFLDLTVTGNVSGWIGIMEE